MRIWHELVAAVGDLVPGGVPALGLWLLLVAGLASLLWYWFPEWALGLGRAVMRLLRALAGWRLRWRRRRKKEADEAQPDEGDEQLDDLADEEDEALAPDEELPAVPAGELALSADDLAAQGRFREAVRERLRAIVRDLVERGVLEYRPGWTVTELAAVAGQALPPAAGPLAAASEVFSRIWYGQLPATAADDAAMREYAGQVRAALEFRPAPVPQRVAV